MNTFLRKSLQMQLIIVACCLLGTTYGASLLGIDFSGPKEVLKTGIEEIYQMLKPNIQQHTNSPLDFNNQTSDSKANEKKNVTPSGLVEDFKNKTEEPPKIDELTQDYNQTPDSGISIMKQPSDSEKEPGLLNPNKTDQETGVSELVTDSPTADCWETETDYTNDTSEYEKTTPCASLNRIGGVPPNVMASLLG